MRDTDKVMSWQPLMSLLLFAARALAAVGRSTSTGCSKRGDSDTGRTTLGSYCQLRFVGREATWHGWCRYLTLGLLGPSWAEYDIIK